MSNLSKRLDVIKGLVDEKIVCDVGCDHGKLAYSLLTEKIVDFVFVSDISKPSLNKAEKLLHDIHGYKSIHCDGLQGYTGCNIDECIIAGMGGDEIINIIKNSPIQINKFILSPQHNNIAVKKFMIVNGYEITFDIIVKDKGKFYNIIKFEKGEQGNLSEFDLYFGKNNFNSTLSDIDEFVEYEYNKISSIVANNNIKNDDLINYYNILKEYKKRKFK